MAVSSSLGMSSETVRFLSDPTRLTLHRDLFKGVKDDQGKQDIRDIRSNVIRNSINKSRGGQQNESHSISCIYRPEDNRLINGQSHPFPISYKLVCEL